MYQSNYQKILDYVRKENQNQIDQEVQTQLRARGKDQETQILKVYEDK